MHENEIDSETIDTPAGEYRVAWYQDDYADAPYNDGLHFAYDGGRDRIDVTEGDHAAEVLDILRDQISGWRRDGVPVFKYSPAGIARYLRLKYGAKGVREVSDGYYTYAPSTQRDRIQGIAWAPDDATDPDAYTDAAVAEYRAWAEGDVFGWQVTDPSGNDVQSVWGYYGFQDERERTLSEARDYIEYDAAQRIEQVNRVGAGLIGLI